MTRRMHGVRCGAIGVRACFIAASLIALTRPSLARCEPDTARWDGNNGPPPSQGRNDGVAAFQPGVAIDWGSKTVRVDGEVVLRSGPLEFFACLPGREHESIVRLKASAVHIYMALGLVGVMPGHPPVWNEREVRFEPATGDLVEVDVEWREGGDGGEAGELRRVSAFDWMRDTRYARPAVPRPWLFAGSLRTGDGGLEAEASGRVIALVDFSENLLTLSRGHISRDADLWAEANEPAIPPRRTPVTVLLAPARHRPRSAEMDFRGDLHLDGRYVTPEDFADVVLLERRLSPEYVQQVAVRGALASDVARVQAALESLGLPRGGVRFESNKVTR